MFAQTYLKWFETISGSKYLKNSNVEKMLFCVLLLLSCRLPPLSAVKNNIFPEVLRTQQDFVDKSEMLRIFFDQNYTEIPSQPYYYISTPRHFAKSINIDMVHTFAAKKFDNEGNPVNPTDTEAHKLFRGLKIAKYESVVSEHLTQYIVLQFDLMAVAFLKGSVEEVVTDMNSLLSIELGTYSRLKTPNGQLQLTQEDKDFIQKLEKKSLTLNDLETGLFTLIRILYRSYNNTPVVLLVDEYDETAFNSYMTPGSYVTGVFKTINEMLAYALVQGKPYLKFVLIQGISTLAYSLDDSLKAVLKHCPFLGIHPFAPFYGFTELEVEQLLVKYRLSETEKKSVQRHYKGYVTANRRIALYNPHSIVNYLYDYKKHSSDFNTTSYVKTGDWIGRFALFLKNTEFRAKMSDLLQNGTLQYSLNKRHKPEAILQLEKLREAKFDDSSPQHVDTLITQSFEMGYLSHGSLEGTYVIPNDEMKDVYEEEFARFNAASV